MLRCSRTISAVLMLVLSLTAAAAYAGGIGIPDASFETRALSAPTPYTTTFAQLLPWIGNWSALVRPDIYAALYAEGEITPAHGLNVAYLNNLTTNRPYLYQTLNYNYLEGATYTLSMAAAEYKASEGADGQLLTLRLGYWTGNPDPFAGPAILAERVIAHSELSVGAFADFSVTTGPVLGDAVGKRIVVYISRADASAIGGRWYVDNVQLSSTPDTPPIPPLPPLSNLVPDGAIGIDGDVSEWTVLGVTPFAADPNDAAAGTPDLAGIWMAHDSNYIYFRMDRWAGSLEFENPEAWGYFLELDTDQNATTGNAGYAAVGPDIAIQGGNTAIRWQLGGQPCGYSLFPTLSAFQPGGLSMEIAIRRTDIGDPAAIGVVGYGYPSFDFYPDGGATTDYFTYVIHEPGAAAPTVVAARSNPVTPGAINADGNAADWSNILSYPADLIGDGGSAQDWVKAGIAHDNDNVYFLIERSPGSIGFDSSGYWIMLDTDTNKATGLTGSNARNFSIGAEFNFSGMVSVNAWAASGCYDHDLTPSVAWATSPDGTLLEISVSRAALGLADPFGKFYLVCAGGDSGDFYPDRGYANNGGTAFLYEFTPCNSTFADADGDQDVDLADYGVFQLCYTGQYFLAPPFVPLAGGGRYQCACFDRDHAPSAGDGDIDPADLVQFLNCLAGPSVPPAPTCGQ